MSKNHFETLLQNSVKQFGSEYIDFPTEILPHTFPDSFLSDMNISIKQKKAHQRKIIISSLSAAAAVLAVSVGILTIAGLNHSVFSDSTPMINSIKASSAASSEPSYEKNTSDPFSEINSQGSPKDIDHIFQNQQENTLDEKGGQQEEEKIDSIDHIAASDNISQDSDLTIINNNAASRSDESDFTETDSQEDFDPVTATNNGAALTINLSKAENLIAAVTQYVNDTDVTNPAVEISDTTRGYYIKIYPYYVTEEDNEKFDILEIYLSGNTGQIITESDHLKNVYDFTDSEPIYQTMMNIINN